MLRQSKKYLPRKVMDISLALGLGMLLLSVYFGDLLFSQPSTDLVVQDEPPEEKPAVNQEPVFQVQIREEPEETLVMPAKYTIEDEPEELPRNPKDPPVKVEIKDEPVEGVATGPGPIDPNPLVRYAVYRGPLPPKIFAGLNSGAFFGISTTAAAGPASFKKLTFDDFGRTNTTLVRINGQAFPLGQIIKGRWVRQDEPTLAEGIAATPGAVKPSMSTWVVGANLGNKTGGLHFHQVLEIVPGQATMNGQRLLDSVLVRWIIHNQGVQAQRVGLRLLLDTLIGGNDGVPFTVPGRSGLVDTFADFPQPQNVPDFLQALEFSSLHNPGTVAHLTAKVGGQIEPPDRLSLTYWPGFQKFMSWDIPIKTFRQVESDSAVVLYWSEKLLQANEKRVIGFAYGLGSIASNDKVASKDKLGVTLGGSFEPGQHFTVTAYVENPVIGQTLRLELPQGLERSEGEATQNVPQANADSRLTSIVTWKVKVGRTGEFRLVVHSSTGIAQAKTISIAQVAAPAGGKLTMDLSGSFEPGQVFQVLGKVNEPLPGQTLSLELPKGLQRVEGEPVQTVPPLPAGAKEVVVSWKVKVLQSGRYPVRVASSTGMAQTKTITIARPGRPDANFRIDLEGDFSPGKVFAVKAKLATPVPNQTLTLQLPPGLQRVEGDEQQRPAAQPDATLTWKVKTLQAGKFPIRVASSTGLILKKNLVIEATQSTAGRFNFDLTGDFRPGKEFTVTAKVTDPPPGQKLTLVLPKELKLLDQPSQQAVPAAATVTWRVSILQIGELPVRVESSTGLGRTKKLILTAGTLVGQ